jgi:hypothetical protein
MSKIFIIEDQNHGEQIGEFSTLQGAWEELQRLSTIPWDAKPNVAPCQSWRTCGRDYEIVEYNTAAVPWTPVHRYAGLEVSAKGIVWGSEAPYHDAR